MWAVFEVIAVPLILLKKSFMLVVALWVIGIIIILFINWKNRSFADYKLMLQCEWKRICTVQCKEMIWYLIMFGLIIYQIISCVLGTQLDEDDSRFVVNALEAYDHNSMFLINPATGEYIGTWIGELVKDVASPWMIYIAMIAKIVHIHPTIMAHTVFPGILVMIAYGIYWMIANELFHKRQERTLFVIFVALINIHFTNSVYTSSVFLLTRIWQGKAIVAGIMIPFIFYLFLRVYQKPCGKQLYILMGIVDAASCLMSGMGIMLSALLIGIMALYYTLLCKNLNVLKYSFMACIPSVVFGIIYAII